MPVFWFRHISEYGSDGMIPPTFLMRVGGFLSTAEAACFGPKKT